MTAGYRGDGLRAWKESGGVRTYYLYVGTTLLCEVNAAGTVTSYHTWGPTGLLARTKPATGEETWYQFDAQGDVAHRLAADGRVLSTDRYDAWGNAQPGSDTADPYGYKAQVGYYRDAETGLYLCTWRYYDPQAGRWLTADPIGYAGGLNVYAYCGNDPWGMMDPQGLVSFVLYDPDDFSSQAFAEMDRLNNVYGTEVFMFPVRTEAEFVASWETMDCGMPIDGVSLLFHGSPHTLTIDDTKDEYMTTLSSGKTPKGASGTYIGALTHRETKELNIISCNTGHLDHEDDNVAWAFHRTNAYHKVTAWDGSVSFDWWKAPKKSWDQSHFGQYLPPGSKRKPTGQVTLYRCEIGPAPDRPWWKFWCR